MGISMQVYVAHPDLGLAPTIRSRPEVEVGVVPDAGTDPQQDVYFFWLESPDFAGIEDALAEDHTVAEFTEVFRTESRRTYRIRYSGDAILLSPPLREMGGLTLDSRSHSEGWMLQVYLPDHDALEDFSAYVEDAGIHFEIFELRQRDVVDDREDFALTDSQVEALVCAYVNGYYDEPKQTTLEELGSMLGISETAVSGRLRRGAARLVESVVGDGDPA